MNWTRCARMPRTCGPELPCARRASSTIKVSGRRHSSPGVDRDMLDATSDYFAKLTRNLDRQIKQANERAGTMHASPNAITSGTSCLRSGANSAGKPTGEAAASFLIAASKPVGADASITTIVKWLESPEQDCKRRRQSDQPARKDRRVVANLGTNVVDLGVIANAKRSVLDRSRNQERPHEQDRRQRRSTEPTCLRRVLDRPSRVASSSAATGHCTLRRCIAASATASTRSP